MKKKIVSILLLSMYFFGGFVMVFAGDFVPINGDASLNESTKAITTNAKTTDGSPTSISGDASLNQSVKETGSAAAAKTDGATTPSSDGVSSLKVDSNGCREDLECYGQGGATTELPAPSTGDSNDMTSPSFTLNPNELSPSEKKYTGGTKLNLKIILANVGKYFLIATTTIAVLSIVVGGLMISTTGPTDRAAKGKTIIMLNITGVIIALFSYSIIRFVSWIIA